MRRLADLLNPMPAHDKEDEHWGDAAAGVLDEREDEAAQLRLAWEEGGIDPLLSTLGGQRVQRLRLEADMGC